MTESNGACSGQPLYPSPTSTFTVKKSKPSEICLGSFGERFNDLDRIDFSYKPRKNSGLVPGGLPLSCILGNSGRTWVLIFRTVSDLECESER